jgi:hypothetical protein
MQQKTLLRTDSASRTFADERIVSRSWRLVALSYQSFVDALLCFSSDAIFAVTDLPRLFLFC